MIDLEAANPVIDAFAQAFASNKGPQAEEMVRYCAQLMLEGYNLVYNQGVRAALGIAFSDDAKAMNEKAINVLQRAGGRACADSYKQFVTSGYIKGFGVTKALQNGTYSPDAIKLLDDYINDGVSPGIKTVQDQGNNSKQNNDPSAAPTN